MGTDTYYIHAGAHVSLGGIGGCNCDVRRVQPFLKGVG